MIHTFLSYAAGLIVAFGSLLLAGYMATERLAFF
jgi:hypothetical protein